MESEKNQAYWTKRNEDLFLNEEKQALNYAKNAEEQYKRAINSIEEKINAFYGKYQTATGMDMTEIRKLLNKNELKSFKSYLNEIVDYAKDHKFDTTYKKDIQLLKYKTNISRLEELKTQIQFEVEKLYNDIDTSMGDMLSDVYQEGYYKTIFNNQQLLGFSSSFNSLNEKAIKRAISTPYMTENYSSALWKNKVNLLNILEQQIPQGIILGYNPRKVASIASKQLGTKYNSTVRLVRTEYNMILNDAVADGYKETFIEQYQILATLDSRTSEICRDIDGQIFDLKEKAVGINYPPFHPNCRTTTIPYFTPDEFDTELKRLAKDSEGNYYEVPANLTYKEWQEGLVEQDGQMVYKVAKPTVTTDAKEWKNLITEPELNALQDYTWKEYGDTNVANFEDINKYLRTGEVSKVGKTKIENAINLINSAISKFKLDKDITVYRGTDTATLIEQVLGEKKFTRNIDALNNYLKGKVINNKGYTSTSIAQKEALNFGMGSGRALLKINVPKGTNGAYINEISRISKEKEFLLGKNTNIKINSIRIDDRLERVVINCTII